MTSPLFEVFRTVMMNKPLASRAEAMEDFVAEMKSNDEFFDLLARDYFERMSAVHMAKPERLGRVFTRTDVSIDKIERQRATARAASASVALAEKIRDVLLLDLTLPNGKTLRQSTGYECARAGGFFAEVSKCLKPTQVVDRHLSEADLKNIRSRFYQSKQENAA